MVNKIIEDEMLLTDKKMFGDEKEHEYDVLCGNGYAFGTPTESELEENPNAPKRVILSYPTLESMSKEDKRKCLDYRGLYDEPVSKCNYADVCMSLGFIFYKK